MRRIFILTALLTLWPACPARSAQQDACAGFRQAVRETYNFKPSRLKSEAEYNARSAAMDRVWSAAKAKPAETLPCLRAALADPQADPWFRFDGSNLLASLDPSPASKAEQARHYAAVDLADVNQQVWVSTLARLGAEGFDTSAAGARWLAHPKTEYYLPRHGAQKVDKFLGALFIYGSMDEAHATPALLKVAAAPDRPARDIATALLLMQATPEAFRGLREVVLPGLPSDAQGSLRQHLERPRVIAPREQPKTTRDQFLKAFGDAAEGRWDAFRKLVEEVPDGEKDVVATLRAEDVPLVRKVRRQMISMASPHAAEYYTSFTQILTTLVWRPEMTK